MKTMPKYRKFMKAHHYKKQSAKEQKPQLQGPFVASLVALKAGSVDGPQIEAMRRLVVRKLRNFKQARVLVRAFTRHPITSMPAETRIGGGKGSVEKWICPTRCGTILIEVSDQNMKNELVIIEALKQARYKLSGSYAVKTYKN